LQGEIKINYKKIIKEKIMKKLFKLMLIAVVIAAFTVPGFAQEKCKHKKMMHHHGDEGKCLMMKELNLTEKQQAEIEKLQKGCMDAKKDLQTKMEKLQEELHKLMAADKPVKESIHKAIEKIGKLSTEMKKICVGCKLKIRALLTPEQLKKWKEMMGKHECSKHDHHEHGHKECKHKHKEGKHEH
jgi:Spy/CpxP family protein refolding chaperone